MLYEPSAGHCSTSPLIQKISMKLSAQTGKNTSKAVAGSAAFVKAAWPPIHFPATT